MSPITAMQAPTWMIVLSLSRQLTGQTVSTVMMGHSKCISLKDQICSMQRPRTNCTSSKLTLSLGTLFIENGDLLFFWDGKQIMKAEGRPDTIDAGMHHHGQSDMMSPLVASRAAFLGNSRAAFIRTPSST